MKYLVYLSSALVLCRPASTAAIQNDAARFLMSNMDYNPDSETGLFNKRGISPAAAFARSYYMAQKRSPAAAFARSMMMGKRSPAAAFARSMMMQKKSFDNYNYQSAMQQTIGQLKSNLNLLDSKARDLPPEYAKALVQQLSEASQATMRKLCLQNKVKSGLCPLLGNGRNKRAAGLESAPLPDEMMHSFQKRSPEAGGAHDHFSPAWRNVHENAYGSSGLNWGSLPGLSPKTAFNMPKRSEEKSRDKRHAATEQEQGANEQTVEDYSQFLGSLLQEFERKHPVNSKNSNRSFLL